MNDPELLLLHALPLDGSMWDAQADILPGATSAPDLYALGPSVATWAKHLLAHAKSDRLIVAGCSVGGSCALEMAAAAPGRIAALVLFGTKAAHDPDPALRDHVLSVIEAQGVAAAWSQLWADALSPSADPLAAEGLRRIALNQSREHLARGVVAFHGRSSRDGLLPVIQCPVVFVSGEDDRLPGAKAAMEQARLCARGMFEVIPRCGHFAPLERPEATSSILRRVIAMIA